MGDSILVSRHSSTYDLCELVHGLSPFPIFGSSQAVAGLGRTITDYQPQGFKQIRLQHLFVERKTLCIFTAPGPGNKYKFERSIPVWPPASQTQDISVVCVRQKY